MANINVYDRLAKIRKPRVHITYDVENLGAREKKELPFVVGVMGDFSGNNSPNKTAFKDRKFIQIEADNFDQVMKKIAPAISFKVENKLKNDGGSMQVDLVFNSIHDFKPSAIAEQVPAIKKLLDVRQKLSELLSKADRSEELELLLEKVLQNSDDISQLSDELGINKASNNEKQQEKNEEE